MKKEITVLALCVMLVALCSSAQAQQPKKPPRLGYLSSTDPSSESKRANVIRMGLRDIGYLDGQNLIIEYRYGGGKVERLRGLAEELVALNVDMILVAGGGRTIRAAKNATKITPLIMVGEGIDPVGARLVESLARPGGNITGVTSLSKELGGKRLELLKEAVPKLARVVAVSDPAIPNNVLLVKEIQAAAGPLGLTVQPLEIRTSDDFDKVFAVLRKDRPDAIYVVGGPLMYANSTRTVGFALSSRLPSMYNRTQDVEAGGLIYYGPDLEDSYRRVAFYVDKILKGAKPADLPVEQPTKFELVINLKTAKQIGLTIPPNVLARADRVIR
jgi:putative ABC transport system substrate-binding protein